MNSSQTAAVLGSFLLFQLELISARMLLPLFGGSAYVWAASMTVFQGLLLAAYLYARWALRRFGTSYVKAHFALLALPLLFLPIRLHAGDGPPLLALLAALMKTVAVPFFVLSTTVPVLQSWQDEDSYVLFGASNSGALAALLCYPFLIEPFFPLDRQARAWAFLYIVYAVLMLMAPRSASVKTAGPGRVSPRLVFRWIALSAGPSAAMLAATNFLSFHFASVPLLWILPLTIYLATYVLNFKRDPWVPQPLFWPALLSAGLGAVLIALSSVVRKQLVLIIGGMALDLGILFALGMLCHRALCLSKPRSEEAPAFYAALGVGGWLGSLLVGIAVPCLGRYGANLGIDWTVAFLLCAAGWAAQTLLESRWKVWTFAASAAVGAAFALHGQGARGRTLEAWRNFYGVYRVEESGTLRRFVHGNTVHGLEYLDPARAAVPLAYYHEATPIARLLREQGARFKDAAVVGLGVGVLAAFGRDGQALDFYELDFDVVRAARERFGYLAASRARVKVVTGDARLSLSGPGPAYDLIVLDAFASDAMPAHLLTKEAFEVYLKRLAPGGLIVCNISSRLLDLKPVLGGAARALGLSAFFADYDRGSLGPEFFSCRWAALSRDAAWGERLSALGWEALPPGTPWTDQKASLLSALRL